ncbi:hypothetical protein CW304_20185 [Bacillus sp. UFRGS-B20]|nr:hypothetical protein CW304_20185 [Bacillus sp. UFRGS-B20]
MIPLHNIIFNKEFQRVPLVEVHLDFLQPPWWQRNLVYLTNGVSFISTLISYITSILIYIPNYL